MRTNNLRLFVGSEEQKPLELSEPEVAIRLGEFTQILADAIIWDRTWVNDLSEEHVHISADLYEVLCMYAQMRPSA